MCYVCEHHINFCIDDIFTQFNESNVFLISQLNFVIFFLLMLQWGKYFEVSSIFL